MRKRRLAVVHWAVYMRTLGTVRMYTGHRTCVHRPVDDDKSAERYWGLREFTRVCQNEVS